MISNKLESLFFFSEEIIFLEDFLIEWFELQNFSESNGESIQSHGESSQFFKIFIFLQTNWFLSSDDHLSHISTLKNFGFLFTDDFSNLIIKMIFRQKSNNFSIFQNSMNVESKLKPRSNHNFPWQFQNINFGNKFLTLHGPKLLPTNNISSSNSISFNIFNNQFNIFSRTSPSNIFIVVILNSNNGQFILSGQHSHLHIRLNNSRFDFSE